MLAAASGCAVLAAPTASGSSPQVVTLGNASGSATENLCSSFDCTYLPYAGASDPELRVPFAGTVTSFSVNAGSEGGQVELRVLRPRSSEQFTAVGTSAPETLRVGMNTFSVSLPVATGDVLALDNESGAIIFEKASGSQSTYYFDPAISEESTQAPGKTAPLRLLLSAEVRAAPAVAPVLSDVAQTHRVWREGTRLAAISSRLAPVGTTFSFGLSEPATVKVAFTRRLSGREVAHRCVAQERANAGKRSCTRTQTAGRLSLAGHGGVDRIKFDGRLSSRSRLKPGRYTATISASNAAGTSRPHSLSFDVTSQR